VDHGQSSKQLSQYHPRSRESYSSRGSHDSYSQETQVRSSFNPVSFHVWFASLALQIPTSYQQTTTQTDMVAKDKLEPNLTTHSTN